MQMHNPFAFGAKLGQAGSLTRTCSAVPCRRAAVSGPPRHVGALTLFPPR